MRSHFPRGAADPVGSLLKRSGSHAEHIAHDGTDIRKNHQGEDEPGGQEAEPVVILAEKRHFPEAERISQKRLDVILHHGGEDEKPPHSVDDAGNRGKQVQSLAQRISEPFRRIHKKQRGNESQRSRDADRDHRRHQRSADRRERSVKLLDGVPLRRQDEFETECPERFT